MKNGEKGKKKQKNIENQQKWQTKRGKMKPNGSEQKSVRWGRAEQANGRQNIVRKGTEMEDGPGKESKKGEDEQNNGAGTHDELKRSFCLKKTKN